MHLGAKAIQAEKLKMLCQFDIAKSQISDDAVKVDHGKVAESIFREHLENFLPRMYGVCKGYIISRKPKTDELLEEWDIIIYDALKSPILFVRSIDGESRRGIPIEYVKAVIEVKASLTKTSAKKVKEKLVKLTRFVSKENTDRHALSKDFFVLPVFFETDTKSRADYKACLDQINKLACELGDHYEYSLILRSQKNSNCSAIITRIMSYGMTPEDTLNKYCESSSCIEVDELPWYVVSLGFSESGFPQAMMALVDRLNDGLIYQDYAENSHKGYGSSENVTTPEALWR